MSDIGTYLVIYVIETEALELVIKSWSRIRRTRLVIKESVFRTTESTVSSEFVTVSDLKAII